MTMIDEVAGRTGIRERATWAEVDTDFWVGSAEGVFLGTIERHEPNRYFARDAVRHYVGEYPSLALAREAVVTQME
ncbi:hypothetical protein ACFUTX_03860 [Microbacterium sp. NPDC057407]|uniref:hypothetical protein n=1 Tax=Microbacterium sp. NPDC057407 TaxID=3346120 RepID=UPI0036726D7C